MAIPHSYHCICTTFVLVTGYDLTRLPERGEPGLDKAIVLPTQNSDDPQDQQTIMTNLVADRQPTVIRRDDGFEKRTLLRCQRCKLVIAYRLDEAQFKNGSAHAQDVVYVLPGALMSTEDMMEGKTPAQTAAWAARAV